MNLPGARARANGRSVPWGWIAVAFLVPSCAAFAQGLVEHEFGEPWNGVGFGARAIGMGGAYTAVSDDLDGQYYNPGGMVRMRDTQIGVMSGSDYWKRSYSTTKSSMKVMSQYTKFAGLGFATTMFRPWTTGLSLVRNFHPESATPWQDDYIIGTFVLPLNAARTGGVGINVKYVFSDLYYTQPFYGDPGVTRDSITGWAVDTGIYYSIPMPLRDRRRELSFGLNARNVVGKARVLEKEKDLPAMVLLGAAFSFDDIIPREKSVISLNFDQRFRSNESGTSSQLRVGYEQWFFRNYSAMRFGYATPLPNYDPVKTQEAPVAGSSGWYSQGVPVWSLGLTVLAFSMEADLGITIPTERIRGEKEPGLPETEVFYQADEEVDAATNDYRRYRRPIDRTRFYFQVSYHFSRPVSSPWAKVGVEPLVFAPRKGEVAVFIMDYKDERGLLSWELGIKNSARVPVRSFSGKGVPPERLVWDGLDDRFNLAPDDDHTYTLTVKNRDGIETVTSPQSLKVFTPGEGPKGGDPSLIYKILKEEAEAEAAKKAAERPLIEGRLKQAKESLGGTGVEPGGEPAPGIEPGGAGLPLAPMTAPSATVSELTRTGTGEAAMSYKGLTPEQIIRVQVPASGGVDTAMVTEYRTQQYIFSYLAREIRNVTIQNYATVGATVGSFMVQARYGNHLIIVETPMEVARRLKNGDMDEKQWVRLARISLDGKPIQPVLD